MKATQLTNEFDAPRWSVLTFNDCAASGLTYAAAADFVAQNKGKLIGLCIVTDEAARRRGTTSDKKMPLTTDAEVAAPATFSDLL